MNGNIKAYKIVRTYMNKAMKDLENNGYHENLGYEYSRIVKEDLEKLFYNDEISYSDMDRFCRLFNDACDNL